MKTIEFEPIPEHHRTLNLQLLKRVKDFALYVTDCCSFEIHKIRILKDWRNPFSDVLVKEKEKIASSEEFGTYGWSYETLTYALKCHPQFQEFKDEISDNLNKLGYVEGKISKRGGKYYQI